MVCVCPETELDVYLDIYTGGWRFNRNDGFWLCSVDGKACWKTWGNMTSSDDTVRFKTKELAVVWWVKYKRKFCKPDWRKDGF